MRPWALLLLLAAAPGADAQAPTREDTPQELAPVVVTAPRMRIEDLYTSKPPPRTPPTVFDKAWREPVNLKKIGDEGGVVPILVRYAAGQVTRAARSLPGWKGPDQPARARPAPLDDAHLQRAVELQAPTPRR